MRTDVDALPPPEGPRVYTVVGAGASVRVTRPFAWLAVATIWLLVAASAAMTITAFQKVNAWRDAIAGRVDVSVPLDLSSRLTTIIRLSWLAALVGIGARAWWSRRVVQNAVSRGVPGMRVDVATFAWLVPLFGLRPGIGQLRRAVQAVDYSDHRLVRWLFAAYVSFFVGLMVLYVTVSSWQLASGVDARLDAIDTGNQMLVISTVWSVVWAVLATSAILHADRAVTSVD
jgi:hypothetical protein